ncbi:MAG TPA: transglutaminase domain-containing protein [Actinoplanes sp.]
MSVPIRVARTETLLLTTGRQYRAAVMATIGDLPYPPDEVRGIVERIRLVPDAMRTFSQTSTAATRTHRIRPELLAHLLDLGLPHRTDGGELSFDEFDLSNVGVALDLPCARRMAMRWWAKALAGMVPGNRTVYSVDSTASCPSPGHPGPCPFVLEPRVVEAMRAGSLREHAPGRYSFDVELTGRTHHFGAAFAPLVERAKAMRFHLLPINHPMAFDLGLLAETGLADCRLATKALARLADELRLPVRPAIGYLMAPPYPQAHGWIEFKEEGRWWPADPFLLNALAGWGIVDPGLWPPDRSPEGLLWRLSERGFREIAHGDATVFPKMAIVGRSHTPTGDPRGAG